MSNLDQVDLSQERIIETDLIAGQRLDLETLVALEPFSDTTRRSHYLEIETDGSIYIAGQVFPLMKVEERLVMNALLAVGEEGLFARDIREHASLTIPGVNLESRGRIYTSGKNNIKKMLEIVDKTAGFDQSLFGYNKVGNKSQNWLDVDLVIDYRTEQPTCIERFNPEKIDKKASKDIKDKPSLKGATRAEQINLEDIPRLSSSSVYKDTKKMLLGSDFFQSEEDEAEEIEGFPILVSGRDLMEFQRAIREAHDLKDDESYDGNKAELERRLVQANACILEFVQRLESAN